ncbi:MAG: dihydroorotate dehydrogenase [candidate division NC10 bacterium]|nr:dihydroorotate dehydrogenase [candidate division NC10 bacterium]
MVRKGSRFRVHGSRKGQGRRVDARPSGGPVNCPASGGSTVNLSVEVAGISMKNPVMTASGTFGYGEEFGPYLDLNCLGAIVVKTITLEPRPGNPPPRIAETPAGMLNAIGLQNVGVRAFLKEKLPYLRQFNTPIIVNIAGVSIKEYQELARRLSEEDGIAGIELNISCPNVENGMVFGSDPKLTHRLVSRVRKATPLPLIPKLSPNVTDITAIARAAEEAGADALSLINTLVGMAVDIETRRPKLANITGGLSGPAIRPIAVRMVYEVAQAVETPIIGMGGIMTAEDALEFLIAGATAVAVGTANFIDPVSTVKVIEGITRYLAMNGLKDIKQLIGSLKP